MPELPEVETVRRGLEPLLLGRRITAVRMLRRNLRTVIAPELAKLLPGSTVQAIRRRAKYLLIDTDAGTMLNHLGMTGTWRVAPAEDERTHDHCYLTLDNGTRLAYRDPRRFGLLEWIPLDGHHATLDALGPEPLSDVFTPAYVADQFSSRTQAVKAVIMEQAVVVGVGNIYAQESCFRAKLLPRKRARRVTMAQIELLVSHIRTVLSEAIAAGGSTISDFRAAGGDSGYFQHNFQVYGRGGEPCVLCGTTIRSATIAGRSTCWCPTCQR